MASLLCVGGGKACRGLQPVLVNVEELVSGPCKSEKLVEAPCEASKWTVVGSKSLVIGPCKASK